MKLPNSPTQSKGHPQRVGAAVGELKAKQGHKSIGELRPSVKAVILASASLIGLLSPMSWAQPEVNALPTGGQLVAGSASISQNAANMVVNQASQRAAIDWQSFNVGANAAVTFNQPAANSVMLNRITGNNASQIFGQINANGQVILANRNGTYFAPGAAINVGGILATTGDISNADFMAGNMLFNRNGATGKIVNQAQIQASLGGYIALLAPEVQNDGVLVANLGKVILASGESYRINFDQQGSLLGIDVTAAQISSLIENKQAIKAPGGLIILSAKVASDLQNSVVRNSGQVSATSLVSKGGRILLEGTDIGLSSTSQIEAKGATGGGDVLVGGDWQGSGSMQQATTVTMDAGAAIDVSATDNGDGGKVVLWSDITNADSLTEVHGDITARGGEQGGDGGQIETSGATLNVDGISVDAGSITDDAGLWLLDPYDYIIDATAATAIGNALGTSNVEVTTISNNATYGATGSGNGDIKINSAITKTTGSAATTLTLKAARHISLASGVDISSTSQPLNVHFHADTDNSGDGINIVSGNISDTNGGWVKFGNGDTATIGGETVYVGGDVYLTDTSAQTISTAGGAIDIYGEVIIGNTNGLTLDSSGGNVTLHGQLNSGNS